MNYPELERLIQVVNDLRDPETGCPWDLEQTHHSLLKYLVEESYEFIHAVEENDDIHMQEEIGDVLLQVLLHSRLGSERQAFDIESVSKHLADKMIRRHPHVFNRKENENLSSRDVTENWKQIKEKEKGGPSFKHQIDDSYLNSPALHAANKIGKKTNKIKFDWSGPEHVLEKVEEELAELKAEIEDEQIDKVKEEFGDFIFSVAQLGRHLGLDPEETLRQANKKFLKRFQAMELLMDKENVNFKDLDQSEMEKFWSRIKKNEKA